MDKLMGETFGLLALIVGVALLAVLVSNNANTAGVLRAAGGAFSQALGTAVSPVTGSRAGFGSPSTF